MNGRDATNYMECNLVGSVGEVREKVERYIEAGVRIFSALIFVDNTLEETRGYMQFLAEEIASYGKSTFFPPLRHNPTFFLGVFFHFIIGTDSSASR